MDNLVALVDCWWNLYVRSHDDAALRAARLEALRAAHD
jgi:hypothetical protein